MYQQQAKQTSKRAFPRHNRREKEGREKPPKKTKQRNNQKSINRRKRRCEGVAGWYHTIRAGGQRHFAPVFFAFGFHCTPSFLYTTAPIQTQTHRYNQSRCRSVIVAPLCANAWPVCLTSSFLLLVLAPSSSPSSLLLSLRQASKHILSHTARYPHNPVSSRHA